MMSIRLVILMRLHLKSLCFRRWIGKDGKTPMMRKKERVMHGIWMVRGPFPVFLLGIVLAFWKPKSRSHKTLLLEMRGLGDMNFGDMGGDEYDSDDEDEIEWDS